MKKLALAAIVLGAAGIASAVYLRWTQPPEVSIDMTPRGLKSVKVDGLNVLESGQFRVEQVLLRRANGETYTGAATGAERVDPEHHRIADTFPWGVIETSYAASGNRLTLTISTANSSSTETIESVRYTPLYLRFPEKVKEYDGTDPLLFHNLGQVAAFTVSYGAGVLAVVSEDIEKPLMIGFPWAINRPANTQFPLSVHTGRVKSYPDSFPTIHRQIPPKSSDQYVISLRFGRKNATQEQLTSDVYRKFAQTFPSQLKWTDHRPVGAVFLASAGQNWNTNPRGWFNDPSVNVSTPEGRADFRKRLLSLADSAIQIMRDMNAQGAITWDPEGQQYAQSASYAGDPRLVDKLAPEMTGAIDEYFKRFTDAGLRTGICVRPQMLQVSSDGKTATQTPVDDPTSLLIDKIAYAKKRWGVTLIYLDSNTNPRDAAPIDAAIVQKVAEAFPDILIIPEHSNLRYYAYSVPYKELRQGILSTPDQIREAYPKAFSMIYTADGPLDLYHDRLAAAVRRGDTTMYRTWFDDPQNQKVKSLYAQ